MCYMAASGRAAGARTLTDEPRAAAAPRADRGADHYGEGRVGVRELRQNLSVYLDRVKLGETLTVTEHGRVVALLQPAPASASPLDALIDRGLARTATRSLRDVVRQPRARAGERPLSAILEELRRDDRS